VPGCPLPMGRWLVVYDLGAGTFDVAVLRRTVGGFEVVAADGLPDVGGLDLDAVVVGHLRSLTAGASAAWGRLDWPEDDVDQRARAVLWQGAREAKEQLSRHPAAEVYVPLVEARPRLTRDEFDKAARPHLDRTVALTLATLRAAGVTRETIAGLFLVGGSTRVPLVATLLHRALRVAPTVLEQPELVVAEGSLNAQPTTLPPSTSQPTTVRPTAPAERAPAPAPGWVAPAPAPTHAGIAPAEVEPSDRVPTPRDAVSPVEEQETRGCPVLTKGPPGSRSALSRSPHPTARSRWPVRASVACVAGSSPAVAGYGSWLRCCPLS
jgi:Hsp70 protein